MVDGRVCNRCKEFKVWTEFAVNKKGINDRKSICKKCSNLAQIALNKSRKEKDPLDLSKVRRAKHLKLKYGMSLEDYDCMLQQQAGKCAICGKKDNGLSNQKQLYIDHCHDLGHVRGLLCYYCNTVLGLAFDDVNILQSAIEYLKRDKTKKEEIDK